MRIASSFPVVRSWQKHWTSLLCLALAAALSVACSGGDQTPAVKKAIEAHLASRSDLAINQMTMDVKSVQVDGDKADAEVLFRVTSAPDMQMGYHYDLAREGGNWKVVEGRPSQTDSKHPSASANPNATDPNALPPGHPPLSGTMPEGHPPMPGQMPEGHPPATGQQGGDGAGAMPPGHP